MLFVRMQALLLTLLFYLGIQWISVAVYPSITKVDANPLASIHRKACPRIVLSAEMSNE
jgi:hypothetical protein